MGRQTATSLAPGFRFHPTDEELVRYYLKRKVSGKPFRFDPISVTDIYKSEPWDLPCKSKLQSRDLEWYFFSALDKKYGNGSRTNRATEKGYWKTTGKDRPVRHNSRTVGMKKTLVYHSGRAPRGIRTNWVMHEYRLTDEELEKAGVAQDAFVVCRIFQKSGTGPKNGEQYGAPLIEEEWEDDDVVALVSNEEVLADERVGSDEFYIQANDLEQNIVEGVTSKSAPQLNFYHGECSNYAGHCQEYTEEKPATGNTETSDPSNSLLPSMPEQFIVDGNPAKEEYMGEPSNDENPANMNYFFNDFYLDATDNLLAGDGSFLETNDLVNPIEANTTSYDMFQDHHTYFDPEDDVTQYLDFDNLEMLGTRDLVSEDVLPVDLKAVEEIEVSKHGQEVHDNNGASSSKNKLDDEKLELDVKHPFLKQASHMLENIPAPPAFAAEFPSKDAMLQLHSAAAASNSIHVTAGMITIRNITLRGDGLGWTFSKNGCVNIVLFPGLSQDSVPPEPTAYGLTSRKTAFLVSHGWIFLMLFWALIILLRFKVGNLLYAGN